MHVATDALAEGVIQGDRASLARAVTLVESSLPASDKSCAVGDRVVAKNLTIHLQHHLLHY